MQKPVCAVIVLLTLATWGLVAGVEPPADYYCGKSYSDATACRRPCPRGADRECDSGERCFADVTCDGGGGGEEGPMKEECGLGTECPLLACCSRWGFCGWTEEHCNADCQSNCEFDVKPVGSCGNDRMTVNWAYYASWAPDRKCERIRPRDLDTSKYTHLAFSFALVSESFELVPSDNESAAVLPEFTDLKVANPDLRLVLAVGGWAFNDPPTQDRFTKMVATSGSRRIFINSAMAFLRKHNFDGLDLDWEYPGAPDRGGRPQDFKNYVALLRELRAEFNAAQESFELTIAVPLPSYYLQYFDLPAMAQHVDHFNVMSYDLHGKYMKGHTNMTEIREGLKMFWKNGVPSSQLVLGLAAYGRTWTLADPGCTKPGCPFSGPGKPGPCTDSAGFLAHFEIKNITKEQGTKGLVYDPDSSSMILVVDDQWISFDDADTLGERIQYAREQCLRGTMTWSADMILEG